MVDLKPLEEILFGFFFWYCLFHTVKKSTVAFSCFIMGLMVKTVRDASPGLARSVKWAENKVFLDGGKAGL